MHRDRHVEITHLLSDLEGKLAQLEELQHDITRRVGSLAAAARTLDHPRSVYSLPVAAHELGVSTSMVHKLLKQGRLEHLKVGARTVFTADHLARFREATQVLTRRCNGSMTTSSGRSRSGRPARPRRRGSSTLLCLNRPPHVALPRVGQGDPQVRRRIADAREIESQVLTVRSWQRRDEYGFDVTAIRENRLAPNTHDPWLQEALGSHFVLFDRVGEHGRCEG